METISVDKEVARLLRLTSDHTKKNLSECSNEVAIAYLAELFKGNGWIVSIHTGFRNTKSVLLSEPRQPDNIILIVKFIADKNQITYERAKAELSDFETNIGPVYGCSQFCILTINGFENKAERLENFNLLLQNWSDMEEYIAHYSKDKVREPRIQLFAHNKQTYKKVRKLMVDNNAVAVVQATGTGKSYLIARLLQDFAGERKLVMAPSHYIIDQIKEHIRWESDNIEFMTYAKSMNLSEAEIAELKPKMIVLDEFHRCGAEEWGRGVQNIIDAYPRAFRFGTSATPIRYLDNGRDMSNELFKGHVAENLNLAQAIVRNILPMPKYVCALYTLDDEISTLRSKIQRSNKRDHVKHKMLLDLDTFHLDWEQSKGIPYVFKKHLRKSMRKFIVFCRDEAHLLEMEPTVKKWFKDALEDVSIKTYRVYSNESERDEQLEDFKTNDSKDHLHLLFSVNMLNEGLHVNEVHGVILLRPTESPNIFYQQIGRCLKVGLNHTPVIFDFVNNFRTIRTHDFLFDLVEARKTFYEERSADSMSDRCPQFTVEDEVREINELFGEISFNLDRWEEMYSRLVEFKKRFGHCNVPEEWKEDDKLSKWVARQRMMKQIGKLDEYRFKKLEELGFTFHFREVNKLQWEEMFVRLTDFKNRFGHCIVPDKFKEFPALTHWLIRQRKKQYHGTLEKDKYEKLKKLGAQFDYAPAKKTPEEAWEVHFNKLVEYKKNQGHMRINNKGGGMLPYWTERQRSRYRQGILEADRIKKLEEIGFEWETRGDVLFEKRIAEVLQFQKEQGHMNFKSESELGRWAFRMRTFFRDGKLSEEQVQQLTNIGFSMELKLNNTLIREKRMAEMEQFKAKYGHCNVTVELNDFPTLYEWVAGIRKQYKKKNLRQDTIEHLNAMGFEWSYLAKHRAGKWENMYNRLVSYYQKHGSTVVNLKGEENETLRTWCAQQKGRYRIGKMTPDRIEKLNRIGFVWQDAKDQVWDENFNKLVEFKKKNGHLRVSPSDPKLRTLNTWIGNHRKVYNDGKMPPERIKKLESIGFSWNQPEDEWQNSYLDLKEFLKHHKWAELYTKNNTLQNWLSVQRKNYRSNKLAKDKIEMLEQLSIQWDPLGELWDSMYNQLVAYKLRHGTAHVPVESKEYLQLGRWCASQRKDYHAGKMSAKRISRLAKLDFPWNAYNR